MVTICIPTTPERRERLKTCIDYIQSNADIDYSILVYENQLGGWVPAVRAMLKPLKEDELVFVIGDDCWVTPRSLSKLLDAYNTAFPDKDGLAQPNDQAWHGNIASYPLATAGYLLKYTYSGYIHAHADEELACVAKKRNKYIYVPEVIVNHRHYQKCPEVVYDETYKLQENTWQGDKRLFDERKGKSNDYENWQILEWD